jgi:hypothetical protein
MAGVRRWIGSHPPSRHRISQGKRSSQADVAVRGKEPERDTHSTEYIVAQLLSPTVLPEEEIEYQGLVDTTF